jgi:phosphopentomutase
MRAIIIVLDSLGIGELPDAALFGDTGANTLCNIAKQFPDIKINNLVKLGITNIDGVKNITSYKNPIGAYGKLAEKSDGKDTTVGHWEIAGVITEKAFPTYPQGFPRDFIKKFEEAIGTSIIGNCVASGTEIIDRLGQEHVKTGFPIVYTSADSVFQIAVHEDIIPIDKLYKICHIAREVLGKEHNVARVIARPFVGTEGNFTRTKNRKDFSVIPTGKTILDAIKEAGQSVACVGKIEDIFCGVGVTESVHTTNNMDGVDKTIQYMDTIENGLIFTNLVDFDMSYGHRRDVEGYAKALEEFDERLPEIFSKLKDADILFITADHGCDPTMPGTDHTREYIPILAYGKCVKENINLNIRDSFADIGATVLEFLEVEGLEHGQSFLTNIVK